MNPIPRRKFLTLSLGASATVMLAQCARGQDQFRPAQSVTLPILHKSQDGLLSLELEASYRAVNLGNRQAYLLAYNGQVPGPRLEANPGDTVKIRFTNNLIQPTNLHYHGLHIPPTGSGDNVFLKIPPGETVSYEFTLSEDHPAGTFWYHPHVHGLVAEQLFGGLVGLFIVRGDLDEIPAIKTAQEEFLVLKDFALDQSGYTLPPGHVAEMTGRIGSLLTASGRINPTITLPENGLLRLRLLNASPSRFFRLFVEDHPFYLIATDGGAIAKPLEQSELFLAPGERAEVLVKGDRSPGTYRLLNQPFNPAQGMMDGMMGNRGMGEQVQSTRSETVATLRYQPTGLSVDLPEQLIAVNPLPEPFQSRRFELQHGMGMGHGMSFMINGQTFDPNRVDTTVKLGTTEDWTILNTGTMAHPFHVHVNKFQVLERNGEPVSYAAWKDVISVAPGEQVKVRMSFQDFTGKTVYHCHVLDHEDRGMMGILDIQNS